MSILLALQGGVSAATDSESAVLTESQLLAALVAIADSATLTDAPQLGIALVTADVGSLGETGQPLAAVGTQDSATLGESAVAVQQETSQDAIDAESFGFAEAVTALLADVAATDAAVLTDAIVVPPPPPEPLPPDYRATINQADAHEWLRREQSQDEDEELIAVAGSYLTWYD